MRQLDVTGGILISGDHQFSCHARDPTDFDKTEAWPFFYDRVSQKFLPKGQ